MPAQERSDPSWFTGTRRRAETFLPWPGAAATTGLAAWLDALAPELVSCAEWRWEEGRRIERRRLPNPTIAHILGGAGVLRLAGRDYPLAAGCLQITPAGAWHEVWHLPGQPLHSIGAHLQAQVLGGGGDLVELLGLPRVLPLDAQRDAPVLGTLATLARLHAIHPPGWRNAGRAELTRLIMHLVLEHGDALRPAAPVAVVAAPRLAGIMSDIERELGDGRLAVEDLAQRAGVSPVHLRTLFRRATGLSPNRYLQSRRVALASRLLRQTDQGLDAIAQAVGLANARVLHRLFRAWTGTTPQRWRLEIN